MSRAVQPRRRSSYLCCAPPRDCLSVRPAGESFATGDPAAACSALPDADRGVLPQDRTRGALHQLAAGYSKQFPGARVAFPERVRSFSIEVGLVAEAPSSTRALREFVGGARPGECAVLDRRAIPGGLQRAARSAAFDRGAGKMGCGSPLSGMAAAFVFAPADPGAHAAAVRCNRHVDGALSGWVLVSRGASGWAELCRCSFERQCGGAHASDQFPLYSMTGWLPSHMGEGITRG
jgi:hypothetical protein